MKHLRFKYLLLLTFVILSDTIINAQVVYEPVTKNTVYGLLDECKGLVKYILISGEGAM